LFAEGGDRAKIIVIRSSIACHYGFVRQSSSIRPHIYLLKGLAGIFSTGLGVLDANWSNVVTTPPFILTIFTTRSQKNPPGCKKQ